MNSSDRVVPTTARASYPMVDSGLVQDKPVRIAIIGAPTRKSRWIRSPRCILDDRDLQAYAAISRDKRIVTVVEPRPKYDNVVESHSPRESFSTLEMTPLSPPHMQSKEIPT